MPTHNSTIYPHDYTMGIDEINFFSPIFGLVLWQLILHFFQILKINRISQETKEPSSKICDSVNKWNWNALYNFMFK